MHIKYHQSGILSSLPSSSSLSLSLSSCSKRKKTKATTPEPHNIFNIYALSSFIPLLDDLYLVSLTVPQVTNLNKNSFEKFGGELNQEQGSFLID
uniref:Uncharacterized protein n=1 Tax=Glossina palpalis gambiensis TaxID=67801 RepID=A0A1B0B130_9MUSC